MSLESQIRARKRDPKQVLGAIRQKAESARTRQDPEWQKRYQQIMRGQARGETAAFMRGRSPLYQRSKGGYSVRARPYQGMSTIG